MKKTKKSVYMLSYVMPVESDEAMKDDGVKGYKTFEDGSVVVDVRRVGCFSTVKNAEAAIRKLLRVQKECNEKWGCWNVYACFLLDELYVDSAFDRYGNVSWFESRRSYLGNGKLCYFSDTDFCCRKKFAGGDDVDKYVKDGDFAYVLFGDRLTPMLIGETTFSKEMWKNRFKKGVYGDETDDSSIAFSPNGYHDHPAWVLTFPTSILAHAEIPAEVKSRCEAARTEYYYAEA